MSNQPVKKGDIKSIVFHVKILGPIPKIGDIITTDYEGYNIEGVILNYYDVTWSERSTLKVHCNVKILKVKKTERNNRIKRIK